ncbi:MULTISPECIES: hypothetical protein [unclassified Synechococcus]|uniref:hypothetical protein n=1 Tax=unclassified Synechococcus TaxID=2626047 RepID=UPI00210296B5|nr:MULTISPECIES: hypothetical protein [unclassified Synechococcus]
MPRRTELLRSLNNLKWISAIPPLQPDTEARWLTQRIGTTHDILHVVTVFGRGPWARTGC